MSINIAIDGPTASGKGTLAKEIAKQFKLKHLDTGAMYRAIGLYMKKNNIEFEKFQPSILKNIEIDFNEKNQVCLNGEDVEHLIRTPDISQISSKFSTIKQIREFLVEKQQKIVSNKGYVAEGRDIGTKVMPEADIKIYLSADVETRARRRYLDYRKQGLLFSFDDVIKEIEEKDHQDMTREFDPLTKTKDAIELDNTDFEVDEQIEFVRKLIESE